MSVNVQLLNFLRTNEWPSDYWAFGLLGFRTIGPSDYWADTIKFGINYLNIYSFKFIHIVVCTRLIIKLLGPIVRKPNSYNLIYLE
jgi:hypothetical protein